MNGLDSLLYDRFIGLTANSIGEKIHIQLKNKQTCEGVFFSIDPLEFKYIIIANPKILISDELKYLDEDFKRIDFDQIIYFRLIHKNIKQFSKGDFQTDVDISKKVSANNKRELVQFIVENEENLYYGNLDEDVSKWDQFELNKQKFNVETTYNEIHYTTELDANSIPKQIKMKAEKIAKEILEQDFSENIHIREERGLVAQTDGDEEERYSSVIRTFPNNTTNENK